MSGSNSPNDSEPAAAHPAAAPPASGASAAAFLRTLPLSVDAATTERLHFDPLNATLIVLRNDGTARGVDVSGDAADACPQLWEVPLLAAEGVDAMSGSPRLGTLPPDFLCVQRAASPNPIEIVHLKSGRVAAFHRKHSTPVLGHFWAAAESATCKFVLVTPVGLELFSTTDQGLQYMRTHKAKIAWFKHNPKTRIVVWGSGPRGSSVSGLQLLAAAKSPVQLPAVELGPPGRRAGAGPPFDPDTLHLVRAYSKVYLAHHTGSYLDLYRCYTNSWLKERRVSMWQPSSAPVTVSVFDNLLVVSHPATSDAVVIEVEGGGGGPSPPPVPTPLGVLPPPAPEDTPSSDAGDGRPDGGDAFSFPSPSELAHPSALAPAGGVAGGGLEEPPSSGVQPCCPLSDWQWCVPNIVVVPEGPLAGVHVMTVDLQQLCAGHLGDPEGAAQLAGLLLLQRRRADLHGKQGRELIAQLLALLARDAIQSCTRPEALRAVFNAANAHHAGCLRAAEVSQGAPALPYVSLPPGDWYAQVFLWLHREEAVGSAQLTAALLEYVGAAAQAGVALGPSLHLLLVDLWLEQGQGWQVVQMVRCQFSADSLALAEHLDREEGQGRLEGGRDLAIEMYGRLAQHAAVLEDAGARQQTLHRLVDCLLRSGSVLAAMQRVKDNLLTGFTADRFQAAVEQGGDPRLRASVQRFCQTYLGAAR